MNDKMQPPFISIVIPTRNEQQTLKDCLDSLTQLNYPKLQREILIIDGMSTDNTRHIAELYDTILVENPKWSHRSGVNLGFEKAKGDIVAFTDADCIVDENWLQNSLKYFGGCIAGVSGPIQIPRQANTFQQAVAFLFSLAVRGAKSSHREAQEGVQDVEDFPTCNAIYRKAALRSVMPLDEKLYGGSDLELNYRLRQEGYKLLATPDVRVQHCKRDTPKRFWIQMYRYAIARLQLGKRWPKLLNLAHVVVGLSIPLAIVWLSLCFWINLNLVLFFLGLIMVGLLLICPFAFLQTKSFSATLCVPLVIFLAVTGWSIGFCRELIWPVS